jgi:SAM-dependent methyltransferase
MAWEMSPDPADHWQRMYETRRATDVSWYQPMPTRSLELIQATGVPRNAPILDVGGGTSRLPDSLLAAGYTDLSVLDVAPAALAQARARLGPLAERVTWVVADVTNFEPERRYALWHDRAVLHFLLRAEEQARYLAALRRGLTQQGHVVLATFGPGGPERCSGLPVQRYSLDALEVLLGPGFQLRRSEIEQHRTPAGGTQEFLYTWWQAAA